MKKNIVWCGIVFMIGCGASSPNSPTKETTVVTSDSSSNGGSSNPTPNNPSPTNPVPPENPPVKSTIISTVHIYSREVPNQLTCCVEVNLDGSYQGLFPGEYTHEYEIGSKHYFDFFHYRYGTWHGELEFREGDTSIVIYLNKF